jgi:hypothetical protein
MANELTVVSSLSFTKGGVTVAFGGTKTVTVAGDKYIKTVQAIGTSEEAIQKGELGTLGFMCVKNLDDTNFVLIVGATGLTSGNKLMPGESGVFRLSGNAPFAKADTAPCNIEFMIVED